MISQPVKGPLFPATSFSLSTTENGEYVYFVTLETIKADDQLSNGKRWLNRIAVNPEKMNVTTIPMPDWAGWPGDGGDDGVAVTPDNTSAYLPHSLITYRVTAPASVSPKVSTLQTESGDGALVGNDGQKLFAFDYGDVNSINLSDLKKSAVFSQSGNQASFIENAQLYDNGQKLSCLPLIIRHDTEKADLRIYICFFILPDF